ncbi:MAG: hypothetical protein HXX12_09130 [Geothrix sp.]|uniref:hypothetical protein n=1 Tax=Geothrix sp. TaxID=1962974 RepID=UPI001843F9D1|nr:hypothetical protein [Geothrix sp.]NWJ41118.1 hypothetical protein [Geothrix sp.]WIL20891.1 MAG: hypothetical protein QOZ81_000125 [Geothrix sp.]
MPDQLPSLEGTTLSGRALCFPRDLPAAGVVLVIGFTHGARHDVGAWKAALAGRGIAFLSLPTAERDTAPESMAGVAEAMRAHVPSGAWDQVVQVHRGGEALKKVFGWQVDVFAKLLRVTREGDVLARHDEGSFSEDALAAFLG